MKQALFFLLIACVSSLSVASNNSLKTDILAQLLQQDLDLNPQSSAEVMAMNLSTKGGLDQVDVVLTHPRVGDIHILLQGPHGFMRDDRHSFGSLLLVSGFFTGRESVGLVPAFDNQVIVGFEYPVTTDQVLKQPQEILRFIRQTPGQIALVLKWLSQQSWQSGANLNTMGVSLGGLFLPAGLHLAQLMGVTAAHTIFVCTGANLTSILEFNLNVEVPESVSRPLILAVNNMMTLAQPKDHLPTLVGAFLILRTDHDTVIPEDSTQTLFDLLPGEKTLEVLPGPHINPDQIEVLRDVQVRTLAWLAAHP